MIRSTLVIALSAIGLTVLASVGSVLLFRSSIIEQPINQGTPLTNVSDLFQKVQPGDAPLLLKTYLSNITSADELVQGSESARTQEQSRDAPLTLKIYLFNITNADEIKQGSVSPRLQEVGPYVFREKNSITGLNMSQQATN
ncbi:hypothetical protein HDE_10504 [Halotydeus destructor]|nr:hypothetical protein HDE_10504 [Halotydeus destructor]